MKITETYIKGCYTIEPNIFGDHRGRFVKPYHIEEFKKGGINFEIKEEYFSVSKENVLRGLHFQTPPKSTAKLVTCLNGKIFDVVVDLRKNSNTFLKTFSIELSSDTGNQIFIPEGLAHGFCALSEEATVLYMCSEVHSPENDAGIRWDSAGIDWPLKNPVISEKDKQLVELKDFNNPF